MHAVAANAACGHRAIAGSLREAGHFGAPKTAGAREMVDGGAQGLLKASFRTNDLDLQFGGIQPAEIALIHGVTADLKTAGFEFAQAFGRQITFAAEPTSDHVEGRMEA